MPALTASVECINDGHFDALKIDTLEIPIGNVKTFLTLLQ